MEEMEFVINYLMKQLNDSIDVFSLIKDDVSHLLEELHRCVAFSRDTNKSQDNSEAKKKRIFRELRIIGNKIESWIDSFVIEVKLHQKKKVARFFDVKVRRYSVEIRCIIKRLQEIRSHFTFSFSSYLLTYEAISAQTGHHKLKTLPFVEEHEVVGFGEEANIITDRLLGGSTDLEFIAIVGMLGLGKTTLANMIFKNPMVKSTFPIRIWVNASRSCTRRDICLQIMSQLTQDILKYYYEHEDVLTELVREYLREQRYLIVLDDIWKSKAFDYIEIALPNNHTRSRALLTTRDSYLARCGSNRHLKFLTDDECWELLRKTVFHGGECPPGLEELGRRISRTCSGLPLATWVIAGALASTGRTRSEWRRVHQGVDKLMISHETPMLMELVRMSYDSLPFNLKACFLYCGIFPRGYDIPARKIVLLWIAEGFIADSQYFTLENEAEYILDELVSKSLLMVTQRTANGQIKTFRMHDMLHVFYTLEATEENIFKRIKQRVEQFFPRNVELATFHRLCIDSSIEEFISTKPYSEGTRSFLCFSSQKIMMPPDGLGRIAKSFPRLRVFDIESILFRGFSRQVFQLYHLRYIALSCDSLKVLPRLMEELWNLQTLVILTQEKVVHIKADICSMPRLRHFYTNASAKLLPSAAVKTNANYVLQSLSTIEPESCTGNMSARCQKLKKLGIRGEIKELDGPFLNVNKLECLEKLKIINHHFEEDRKLRRLPSENMFPLRLKQLTLSGTRLGWNEIGKLAHLVEMLEVLKLKQDAFTGDYWESMDDVFTSLEVLWIEMSDLVSWDASARSFPSLKKLVLRHLDKLGELPTELAYIRTLQTIELVNTTTKTVESAKTIKRNSVCTGFELSIFHPSP